MQRIKQGFLMAAKCHVCMLRSQALSRVLYHIPFLTGTLSPFALTNLNLLTIREMVLAWQLNASNIHNDYRTLNQVEAR